MRQFAHSLTVEAPPVVVLNAFFDARALSTWWKATRSLCIPRPLGSYAVEWEPTEWRDAVLGRLGGTFHGTVIEFSEGREFLVAEAYWLPPDGDPIGPMALAVTCTPHGDGTVLHVRQSGWDHSQRWTRYYEVLATSLTVALAALKQQVEQR